MTKYCHYFNNNKGSPYNDIGYMFKHEESVKCRFNEDCRFKLCQCKHFDAKYIYELNVEQEKGDKSEQESQVED